MSNWEFVFCPQTFRNSASLLVACVCKVRDVLVVLFTRDLSTISVWSIIQTKKNLHKSFRNN